MLCSIVAF